MFGPPTPDGAEDRQIAVRAFLARQPIGAGTLGTLRPCRSCDCSVQDHEGLFQASSEVPLPAAAQYPSGRFLPGVTCIEAVVAQKEARAGAFGCELPGDRGVEIAGSPTDAQTLQRFQDEHFAVDDPVEALSGDRVGVERETMSYPSLEVVGHEPGAQYVTLGQRPPHLVRWVGQERVGAD